MFLNLSPQFNGLIPYSDAVVFLKVLFYAWKVELLIFREENGKNQSQDFSKPLKKA